MASDITADTAEMPLVRRIRAGDSRAMEAMFRTYYRSLCLFAERYVASTEVADVVVRDVFTQLWTRRDELKVRGTLRSYLFRTTRTAALACARGMLGTQRTSGVHAVDPACVVGDVQEEQVAEVVLPDAIIPLDEAIAHLPERRRLVLELRWTHQLTYREIAEVVGASVQAVEIQLYRTLTAVRMAVGHPL